MPVAEELDYLEVVASESERFRAVVTSLQAGAGLSSPVPTCPEWDAADLIWHLAEVQYFWTSIVANRPADHTMVAELVRPGDDELIEVLGLWSGRLRSELEAADVGEGCWSWHPAGHNVGWARRRQAHEALIHRVDAELTAAAAGAPFAAAPIDAALAADGIDEMLAVMLGGAYPSPTRHFEADGTSARLQTGDRSWTVALGRYDNVDAVQFRTDVEEPTVTLDGPAVELDLWLWRRGALDATTMTGSAEVAERLQALGNIE